MEPIQWCRQRLLVPGNPLTATLPFAEPESADAILALRTVIVEIASVGADLRELDVGQAKLDWWQKALREGNAHPAIQALDQTGVKDRLPPPCFDALIAGVAQSLNNPRFERFVDAWEFCRSVGGQGSALEAGLMRPDDLENPVFADIGAAGYLIRIVRDLAIDARANRWLVPLDLQADFQVSRQDAMAEKSSRALDGLIRSLLSEALRRAGQAIDSMSDQALRTHRHLLLQWALDNRLARMIVRRPGRILSRRILPGHAGNVWCAWRAARRL
jgi:15-cis-phytoene synthase